MCFLFPCQLTFIFHLSYQLILRFRWIRFVANSFEVHAQPPFTTPLQPNKTKTPRSYKCKPVISLVSAPWLTNGTTDGIFPLHFNLEYIPRSFYLLASIFCCCVLLCGAQFISIMEKVAERLVLWVGNDLQLHWCLYPRGKRRRWRSLKDQRFRPKVDFCVLADASSQDALVNSAPGYRKAISRLRAVHVSNRGAWKSDIGWTHGLQDSYNKNNFALFWAFFFHLFWV